MRGQLSNALIFLEIYTCKSRAGSYTDSNMDMRGHLRNSWKWYALAGIIVILVAIGLLTKNTSIQFLMAFLTSAVVAPFQWILTECIKSSKQRKSHRETRGPQLDATSLDSGHVSSVPMKSHGWSDSIVVVVAVAMTNLFVFLTMNFASMVLLMGFDDLEHRHLVVFSDIGYGEIQRVILGAFLLFIGIPPICAMCASLAKNGYVLRFWAFASGIVLFLPSYMVCARFLGLGAAFGDTDQVRATLGMQLDPSIGSDKIWLITVLVQLMVSVGCGFLLALFQWTLACGWKLAFWGFDRAVRRVQRAVQVVN